MWKPNAEITLSNYWRLTSSLVTTIHVQFLNELFDFFVLDETRRSWAAGKDRRPNVKRHPVTQEGRECPGEEPRASCPHHQSRLANTPSISLTPTNNDEKRSSGRTECFPLTLGAMGQCGLTSASNIKL